MRWRIWVGLLVLLMLSLGVAAQDFDSRGVRVVEQSTQDSFELTATALVLQATETARVVTRRPTAVVNTQQTDNENSQLTETAQADFSAQQVDDGATPVTDDINDDGSLSPLVATFVMFGLLMVALVIFGAIIIRIRDSSEENTQQ